MCLIMEDIGLANNGPRLPKHLMEQIAKIKRMNTAQIARWAVEIYKAGFVDGLREAEHEFDDAIIMDEDEARKRGLDI